MNAPLSHARTLEPARSPRRWHAVRLLHVEPDAERLEDTTLAQLPERLAPGDLLVVNDAATLPASLTLTSHAAELRLVGHAGDGRFRAVVFGDGDWRTSTERRGPAPPLRAGARFCAGELCGRVSAVDPDEPRLIALHFELTGAELWAALYRVGRVVQYAYLERPLELWDVHNRFASRPWAFEPPSAGLPLAFELLEALRRRGVELAWLSHAAGLSSTGSASLDRRLPFPERYELPAGTVAAIERTRDAGGRVVAVGTSVVRALESNFADFGRLRAGPAEARLVLGPESRLSVVSGLLTGMHEPSTSHFSLLGAFAPAALLERAHEYALEAGYLQHEFGDSCLILGAAPGAHFLASKLYTNGSTSTVLPVGNFNVST